MATNNTHGLPNQVVAEVKRLTMVWKHAQLVIERAPGGSTYKQDKAEQDAYDELVEFVDNNELTWTEYDPRGTRAEFEATR